MNYVIDTIALYVLGFFVGIVVNPSNRFAYAVFLGFVTSLVYYVFFETLFQKTPGKIVTGTRVVMRDGSKAGVMTIFIRSLIRIIPFEALTFLTRTTPAGWHDRWVGVYVVPKSYTEADIRSIDMSKAKSARGLLILIICLFLLLPVGGIFSAILFTSLNSARMKARDARRISDVKQLQLGLELYYDSNGHYPASLSDISATDIPAVPTDPVTNESYPYVMCGTSTYHIAATLEAQSDWLSKDADSPPLCAEDTISGDDAHACTAGPTLAAGHCFDESNDATQDPAPPQS